MSIRERKFLLSESAAFLKTAALRLEGSADQLEVALVLEMLEKDR